MLPAAMLKISSDAARPQTEIRFSARFTPFLPRAIPAANACRPGPPGSRTRRLIRRVRTKHIELQFVLRAEEENAAVGFEVTHTRLHPRVVDERRVGEIVDLEHNA